MSVHHLFDSRSVFSFLFAFVFLSWFPGLMITQVVTLDSIQIFTTHELISSKPTVYFQCKGENKTVLPDVKKANKVYTFKAEESWQPLTEFPDTKCKRCGFYEQDLFFSNDKFDEWELCPSDFTNEGKYEHSKEKEVSAKFLCQGCSTLSASDKTNAGQHKDKGMHPALVATIVVSVLAVVIIGVVASYKWWLKRKKQQEQARFLKLFEDGDEIEDELGLENTF